MKNKLLDFAGNFYVIDVDQLVKKCLIDPEGSESEIKEEIKDIKIKKKEKIVDEDEDFEDDLWLGENEPSIQINTLKYEVYRSLIDVIINPHNNEDNDEKLGIKHLMNKLPFDFKISFNTLITDGIIKEIEHE